MKKHRNFPQVLTSATSLYRFAPNEVVHPTTEAEIIEVLHQARQKGLKVRAIGAIHSQAPIPVTDGICLVLDRYNRLVTLEDSRVTVQAGMKLWELNELLAQQGLALPTLGAIAEQTVSGAIATGTHGSSVYCPSLSSYVTHVRLIRADGSILEIASSEEIFAAVGVSLGMLGIVSTLTFECVPAFSLQSQLQILPMKTLIQRFAEINCDHKYVDIKYSPILDQAQILLVDPTQEFFSENSGLNSHRKGKIQRRISNWITAGFLRLFETHRFNWLQKRIVEHYEKTAYATPAGRSDFVLTHFETANEDLEELIPVSDMEIGVPYDQASNALTCLRNYFIQTQKFPSMSVHIRCSAADNFWLSPAYQRAVCWIEFFEYPRTGQFFQEMVQLLQPFSCRYHWGKEFSVNPTYLQQQYEKWHDFLRLRQEWDPDELFANSYLKKYFYPHRVATSLSVWQEMGSKKNNQTHF